MKRHGHWDVIVANDEQPDYNYYTVDFTDHRSGNHVAQVFARVYTNFGVAAKEIRVERLQPDVLKDVSDADLIQIAEIEVNEQPGLPLYVPFTDPLNTLAEE